MSEAEFERRQTLMPVAPDDGETDEPEPVAARASSAPARARAGRGKPVAKARRVQRMFAIEEDLDRKLWLYAIHMGKDRSDVVNDLLRPVVASMVLYDSRDRRSSSAAGQGGSAARGDASSRTPGTDADDGAPDDQAEVA
jgi:hypothetical protein